MNLDDYEEIDVFKAASYLNELMNMGIVVLLDQGEIKRLKISHVRECEILIEQYEI